MPYTLAGERFDLRATAATIEIFRDGRRVASHRRSYKRGGFTTDPAHMPDAHRRYAEWTPSRIAAWAEKIGPKTAELVSEIMRRRPHPEQGFRASLGVIRLRSRYPDERIERACARALSHRAISYRSVEAILRHHLDRVADDATRELPLLPRHGNIRGSGYYH